MRLPLVGSISSRDGVSNKNARLTNVIAEQKRDKTIAQNGNVGYDEKDVLGE